MRKNGQNNFNLILEKNEIVLKILFSLSLPCLTFLLSERANKTELIISIVLSFLIGIVLSFKIFKNMFKNFKGKILIASMIISLYIEKNFITYSIVAHNRIRNFLFKFLNVTFSDENINFLLLMITLPALIELVYIFIKIVLPQIIKIFKGMNKTEKVILLIISILGFVSTLVLYNITNVFFNPSSQFECINDIIYTTDSGPLFYNNAYLNVNMAENDIRQPFFGIFALPFAIIAYILSDLLFFIPNGYAVFLNTVQIFLLACSVYMLTKMLNFDSQNKIIYFIYSFSTFPLIIFSFTMEQYIFAVFYLILAIYVYHFQLIKTNYLYVGAVGTLLTSGIIFPLISKYETFKNWLKNVLKCFIAFVFTTILSGQLHVFVNATSGINNLLQFGGKYLPFIEKLKQFFYFVLSIFIAPQASIMIKQHNLPVYHLNNIEFICVAGIVILILCTISFIINRKNKLSLICFLWIIFSFIILCVLGWGTMENGLILYSLYFSWAYLVLMYLLLDKIIKNNRIKIMVLICICIFLLCYNIPEFIRIINFGITYYKM